MHVLHHEAIKLLNPDQMTINLGIALCSFHSYLYESSRCARVVVLRAFPTHTLPTRVVITERGLVAKHFTSHTNPTLFSTNITMSTPSSAYGSSLTVLVESTSLAPASGSPFQPWAADKGFNPFQYIETQRTDAQDLAQARQLELCDELAATQAKMDKLKTIQHRLAKEDHSQPMVASRIVSAWTQNTLGRAADVVRETKEEAQVITGKSRHILLTAITNRN
jgi:hypothetical protein